MTSRAGLRLTPGRIPSRRLQLAGNHAAAIKMVKMQNGVFGTVSTSRALLEALS